MHCKAVNGGLDMLLPTVAKRLSDPTPQNGDLFVFF